MANEGDQAAAAILTEEASRQQLASLGSKGSRDVPGELMQLHRWFAKQMATSEK